MKRSRLFLLVIVLMCTIMTSVSLGSAGISLTDCLRIIASKMKLIGSFVDASDISANYQLIIWKVRMPRTLLAALVGGSLATVGAAFQGIFRNPLADPHILGVSSGAAVGATVAMIVSQTTGFAASFLGLGTIGIFAFCGALLTVFVVYHVAKLAGEISTVSMLLTGTAISTFLSALISLMMTLNSEQIDKVYMWTLGSVSAANWDKVRFLAVFAIVGVSILICFSQKLNIMMVGEEDAKCLGIDTNALRKRIIVVASLLVAAAVSVSGVIGFVGLIVPHCVRMMSGADNKKVMPASFLLGASFLVICDTISRTIVAPTEIPVGVVTSLFGAPYFIWLVWKRKKRSNE